MHHHEATQPPRLLYNEPRPPAPPIRPAQPHWTSARHPAHATESTHDFLIVGAWPEISGED
jgi:hypothetical protein